MKNLLLILLIVLCVSGCFGRKPSIQNNISSPALQVTGNLVDPEKFRSGGKLGIIAFKAGPQAESNEQLDRLSVMLIKGIREGLAGAKTALLITDDEDKSDLVMEGYIEEYLSPSQFARMILRKKNMRLSVSGEIWYKGTGKKVLTFATSKKIIGPKVNINDEAYQMGLSIADYIMGNL